VFKNGSTAKLAMWLGAVSSAILDFRAEAQNEPFSCSKWPSTIVLVLRKCPFGAFVLAHNWSHTCSGRFVATFAVLPKMTKIGQFVPSIRWTLLP